MVLLTGLTKKESIMKKLLVLLFSLFFLSSPSVFAETYVCSQDLERFGRTGEIETLVFERDGSSFKFDIFRLQISHESKSNLVLTAIDDYIPVSLSVVFINKDTKEWGMTYLVMDEFRKHPPSPLAYGKCVVVH